MDDEKKEILKQTVIAEEEPVAVSLADKLKEKKQQKRKKQIRKTALISFVLLFFSAAWWLFAPAKASATYGICRTLLELSISYPHTLYVSEVDTIKLNTLRLWYTHTDAFGEYRMESFVCSIKTTPAPDGESPPTIEILNLRMHKTDIEPARIKELNHAMIYFQETPLVLNYPLELPENLDELQFDFERFRQYQIGVTKN